MVPLNEVAKDLDLKFHFLGKIAQVLVRKGILVSTRGPKGGFALADPDETISQLTVIKAVNGDAPLNLCVLRKRECDCHNPCPLHDAWGPIMDSVREALKESTL